MINVKKDIVSPQNNIPQTTKVYFTIHKDTLRTEPLTLEVLTVNPKIGKFVDIFNECEFYKVTSLGEEQLVGNMIDTADFDAEFYIKFSNSDLALTSLYLRLYDEESSTISPEIKIVHGQRLEFKTTAMEKDFLPKKIKIIDAKNCYDAKGLVLDPSMFEVHVFATNNALDTTPTWEDVTASYLDKTFHTFTNNVKEKEKSWAVSVKYVIRKKQSENNMEITGIDILVI